MYIEVKRRWKTPDATLGELYVDGVFNCYTLEGLLHDPPKIPGPGQTAIWPGVYNVIINYSVRFNRAMPLLLGVPDFTGVRIHPGNTSADTEGCILVGRMRLDDQVINSRVAFDLLFEKMQNALAKGEAVQVKVSNETEAIFQQAAQSAAESA